MSHLPEDRLERRTHVAMMYRRALADADAAACAELDEVMCALGQHWVYDGKTHHEETDLLTIHEAAEWADVTRNTVRQWIARGHVERRVNADRQITVLMADLIEYQRRRTA
jgi:hypothetical protein